MEITRRLEFDAGHRLLRHEGQCRNIHGHRYVVEVTVAADSLDAVGRVVDFSVIKQRIGGWLTKHWDHAMVVEESDPLLEWLDAHAMKRAVLPFAPTAENMARVLLDLAKSLLPELRVVRVRVFETPNCWADAS